MKQITIILHYDDDEFAEDVYRVLKDVKKFGEQGSVYTVMGREIIHVELKGPND